MYQKLWDLAKLCSERNLLQKTVEKYELSVPLKKLENHIVNIKREGTNKQTTKMT